MIVYEYSCDACGSFEAEQRITDATLSECPSCHGDKVKRLISSTSFVLKGGMWSKQGYSSEFREQIRALPEAPEGDD